MGGLQHRSLRRNRTGVNEMSDGNSQASVHVSKELSKDSSLIATFNWSKSSFMAIAGVSTSHSEIGMAVTDSVNRDTASADSTQGTDNVEQYEGISNRNERLTSLDSNMPLGQDRLASTPESTTKVHMEAKDGATTTKDDDSTLFYSIQPSYLPIPSSILTATSPLPTTDAADKRAILSSMKPVKTTANLNNADRSSMFNMEDATIRANVHILNGDHIMDKTSNNSSTSSGFSLRPPNLLPAMDAVLSANSPVQNVSGYKATDTTSQRSSSSVNTTKNTSFVVEFSASTVIARDETKEILTQHKIVPYKCLVDLNFAERERGNFKLNVWTFRQAAASLSKLTPLSGNLHRNNENEISCGRHCSHVYKCDMFAFDFETQMCALFSLETGEIHLDCTEHERLSCYARCITVE
ncbi:uncharacterized protein LOC110458988 [Mizuhopecten yessoensis]|uniref:uncharacterized protein LOC110458988 n=1 Tax=Mizuhopecten yessoensis TaxID=6573 RepID=UPI000B45A0FA|nr:uncharacterized protein LOC110458988 [Mizuhopecten yessoensis]